MVSRDCLILLSAVYVSGVVRRRVGALRHTEIWPRSEMTLLLVIIPVMPGVMSVCGSATAV